MSIQDVFDLITKTGKAKFDLDQVRNDQTSPADTIGRTAQIFRSTETALKDAVAKSVQQVVDGLTLAHERASTPDWERSEDGYLGVLEAVVSVISLLAVVFLLVCCAAVMGLNLTAWTLLAGLITFVVLVVRRSERKAERRRINLPPSRIITTETLHDSLDLPDWEEDES